MSKEKEYIQELFTKPTETFSEHLELPNNERIIFSGRFGIGKSTFLNHYFEKENAKYNVIHLYPVNYSVLQNEDIFTYLKYDILFDLIINKNVVLKSSESYGITEALPFFVKYKWYSIISLIPLISDKLGGRSVNELMKGLKILNDEYKVFANGPKEAAEFTNPFFQLMHQSEGGLYESNKITEIIKEELENIKEESKENILIIDDLDRIDPAHIFRILNVFSAHFDDRNDNSKNKFSFDRVILVCDIDNIRNIYASIYGGKTDFNGYVDKFFSKEIYRFDNKENVISIIEKLIPTIKINEKKIISFDQQSYLSVRFLRDIIYRLISNNSLNLRNLLKFRLEHLEFNNNVTSFGKNVKSDSLFEYLSILKILVSLFGDVNITRNSLKLLKFYHVQDPLVFSNFLILDHLEKFEEFKDLPTFKIIKVKYLGKFYALQDCTDNPRETNIILVTKQCASKLAEIPPDVVLLGVDDIQIDILPLLLSTINMYLK